MNYFLNAPRICKIMALFIFVLYVTVFCTDDEKSWVRINYAVISQCVGILFFALCLKIYAVNTLMTFIFSWLGNMLHLDTPLIVAIIAEGCRI